MKKTIFQFALIGTFAIAIIIAILIFSGVIKTPGGKTTTENLTGTVVIWGTITNEQMNKVLDPINKTTKTYSVQYFEKKPENYERDLVEALASGRGPDMILLDPSLLTKQSDKIIATPYSLFSERDFKDTFADQGNLFLSPEGVLAIPISIDPIVMYYNKDILNQKGIITPPLYWNDFITLAPKLSEVSQPSGTLVKSMVALGEYDNISHAKDILAMLMLQLGNPIVSTETKFADKVPYVVYRATFDQENSEGARVGESSLRFYTQFADPAKTTYSWNKSFSNSRDLFVSGKLAFYFGYASEYNIIRDKNPNISFDIARVPQVKDYPTKVTYGKMLGIAVLKSSRNQAAAFNTSQYLISPEYAPFLASTLGTAPARRDLLSVKQEDAYNGVVYPSAIIARGWLDPDSEKSDKIFRNMITAVVSGRDSVADAIETAVADLQDALPVAQ